MKTARILFASAFAAVIGAMFPVNGGGAEKALEARPVSARITPRGGLSFGGAEISIASFGPGWRGLPVKADWSRTGRKPRPFSVMGAEDATFFTGTAEWTPQPDAALRGHVEMACVATAEMQCAAVVIDIPAPPPFGLGDGSAADFDLPLSDGRIARLSFPRPVRYHAQDSRPWGGNWTIRFAGEGGHLGEGGPRAFAPGDRLVWEMSLSAPGGLELADPKPVEITADDDWARLDYRKDIVPGSALDFSGQGLQDAPAGKHGWLKVVGGHFEFEGLPGVAQRFYGVNLCFSANYPDHEVADRLVDRLVRMGYNAVRVHHHDGIWKSAFDARHAGAEGVGDAASGRVNAGNDGPESASCPPAGPAGGVTVVGDDDIDRLDYLLAKCFERGLYATTDLYVSRPVAWRDIGIDRDGVMDKQLYKTYVGLHDGAFADWCRWARAFLEHVNPYTGRAYRDEPGLPLLSLVNEGRISMKWGATGRALDPVVRAAWKEYGGDGDAPAASGANTPDAPLDRFDEWFGRRVWERCSAFVRALGCRALLTNDNNGRWHGEGQGLTPLYDYVDNHAYVDPPQFLGQPRKLPSKCGNENPVKAGQPAILHRGWAKGGAKPYTMTEWNFSRPGRYRAAGGLLAGALAAEQEWDGLWRFAYSHNRKNLLDGQGVPGYFDCATDPLLAASDRAGVCLFLRGDAAQEEAHAVEKVKVETSRGSMAVVTPRTCGGFAESGRVDAGPLSFEIVESRRSKVETSNLQPSGLSTFQPFNLSTDVGGNPVAATLWASSLDGEPLERSSRILLTHLTDVQGDGARFADESRKILLKWGQGCLIEAGAADVELKLAAEAPRSDIGGGQGKEAPRPFPAGWRVWALDTAGNRVAEVPCDLSVSGEGTALLRFRVCTAGPEGGRIYYEMVRK